jgi:TRAP-type C4-dicarboxylate transport system permease small subunit
MTMASSPWLHRWRNRVIGLSGLAAGTFLVLMMLVTVIDVVGRYLLNAPLPGAFEMTQFLVAAVVYAGLPHVSQRESHITIDLLDGVTPSRIIPLRDLAVNALCTAAFAVLSWRLWVLAGEAAEWGDALSPQSYI